MQHMFQTLEWLMFRALHPNAGIRFDLGPGSPPAVAAAALAALQGLPPHRFAEALAGSGADTGESHCRML
jgi:hypothetical protein